MGVIPAASHETIVVVVTGPARSGDCPERAKRRASHCDRSSCGSTSPPHSVNTRGKQRA